MTINDLTWLNNFCDGILLLDEHGNIYACNAAAENLLQFDCGELHGKNISIIYEHAEDDIRVAYELQTVLKEGRFTSTGWRFKKDRSKFWCETAYSPAQSINELRGFSCILRDRTKEKDTLQDLEWREERYRLMVQEVTEYANFMIDENGFILTWNEGAKKIKGYLESEIIGKHISIFYTEEDRKSNKAERELSTAIRTGKYEEEDWRVRKDGTIFWANVVLTALFNEQNKLIGLSKVTRDLTDKKHAEEALRSSESRYRSLVEQVRDYGIFLMDDRGRIISWNDGARRIKGYTAEEIIGKYFTIFYPEEEILNGKPAHELKVARTTGQYEEEGWRLRKDGSRFWANIVITAVHDELGHLVGFSKVTRDLTERKQAEKALRDSSQKYREIAEQLKASNIELEAANKELEQFTYIVSHDLQEPIRSIKSFLKLIEKKVSTADMHAINTYLSKAFNTADRMKELILNLLTYSQLSKVEITKTEIPVKKLFADLSENLKSLIRESRAEISIDNRVEKVIGDPVQLGQLLQNLVSNAIKFTDKQNPRVAISVRQLENCVRFSITDNGIGIAQEDVEKVFEIFRRLHTEKDYPGTGIGLAICKKIVDRHHGRIWLESAEGVGTTFYFTLNEY